MTEASDTQPPPTARARRITLPRRLFLALCAVGLLSLAVNLALGGWWMGQRLGGPVAAERGLLREVARSLPEAARDTMRQTLRDHRRELFAAMREMRAARRAVGTVLAAPSLDTEALDAALGRLREATGSLQKVMHEALRDTATRLDPETRAAWSQSRWWAPPGRGRHGAGRLQDTPAPEAPQSSPSR